MNPTHIPGNEPDSGDMAVEPGMPSPAGEPKEDGLPDNEADTLGDFA